MESRVTPEGKLTVGDDPKPAPLIVRLFLLSPALRRLGVILVITGATLAPPLGALPTMGQSLSLSHPWNCPLVEEVVEPTEWPVCVP